MSSRAARSLCNLAQVWNTLVEFLVTLLLEIIPGVSSWCCHAKVGAVVLTKAKVASGAARSVGRREGVTFLLGLNSFTSSI